MTLRPLVTSFEKALSEVEAFVEMVRNRVWVDGWLHVGALTWLDSDYHGLFADDELAQNEARALWNESNQPDVHGTSI